MESDSTEDYEKQKKKHRNSISNDFHIYKSIRVRRTIRMGDEIYGRLLDYNIYLLCVGVPILFGVILLA